MPKVKRSVCRKSLRNYINRAQRLKETQRRGILKKVRTAIPEFIGKFSSVVKLSIIGSVAKKEFYSLNSDTDLLVGGLKNEDYFRAFNFWEDKLHGKIDLVQEEDIEEEIRPMVLKKEVIIYEKN